MGKVWTPSAIADGFKIVLDREVLNVRLDRMKKNSEFLKGSGGSSYFGLPSVGSLTKQVCGKSNLPTLNKYGDLINDLDTVMDLFGQVIDRDIDLIRKYADKMTDVDHST